ncbi:hypothetical protein [Rhodococcus sp. JVH1]|uniref:hypothetical protein n=1 Tax=Rhodococcus sp. JVH1 TaxID=745408 RepID=UPI0005C252C3|nr:hypothetical protein [Rhodococcus sp. JVH1]
MLEAQPCAFESEVVRDRQGKARHRRGGGERRLRAVCREPVRELPVIRAELGIVAAQQPLRDVGLGHVDDVAAQCADEVEEAGERGPYRAGQVVGDTQRQPDAHAGQRA